MKRILCFGDLLSWGLVPGTRQRHGADWRWAKVFAQHTGAEVMEEALNGRTTVYDFPGRPYRKGLDTLPMMLEQHAPLDTVMIMLGTNDFFAVPDATAEHALSGLRQLAEVVQSPSVEPGMPIPKLVLIASPMARVVRDSPYPFADVSEEIETQAARLPAMVKALAEEIGCGFFDASYLLTDDADGIHLSQDTTRELGLALAQADLI